MSHCSGFRPLFLALQLRGAGGQSLPGERCRAQAAGRREAAVVREAQRQVLGAPGSPPSPPPPGGVPLGRGPGASTSRCSCRQGKSQAHGRAPVSCSPQNWRPTPHPLWSVAAGGGVRGVGPRPAGQRPPAPRPLCGHRRRRVGARARVSPPRTGLVGISRSELWGTLGGRKDIFPPRQRPCGGGREAEALSFSRLGREASHVSLWRLQRAGGRCLPEAEEVGWEFCLLCSFPPSPPAPRPAPPAPPALKLTLRWDVARTAR